MSWREALKRFVPEKALAQLRIENESPWLKFYVSNPTRYPDIERFIKAVDLVFGRTPSVKVSATEGMWELRAEFYHQARKITIRIDANVKSGRVIAAIDVGDATAAWGSIVLRPYNISYASPEMEYKLAAILALAGIPPSHKFDFWEVLEPEYNQ